MAELNEKRVSGLAYPLVRVHLGGGGGWLRRCGWCRRRFFFEQVDADLVGPTAQGVAPPDLHPIGVGRAGFGSHGVGVAGPGVAGAVFDDVEMANGVLAWLPPETC